jgi:hypothetical protein
MSQRSSGPAGPPAGGDWPDDLWPADDDVAGQQGDPGAGTGSGAAGTPPFPPGWPAGGPRAGGPRARRLRPTVLAAVIVAGVAAGAAVTAAAVNTFSAGAGPGSQPAAAGLGQRGGESLGPAGAVPGGGVPGGGPAASMFVIGAVTAVNRTSITIGGPGHTVTAAVTGATRVTGKVAGVGGIKVGDQVSAQLTQAAGRVTAVTIADPAQAPGGGSVP